MYGEERTAVAEVAAPLDITRDKRAFAARVRAELHALVKALAARDFEEAAASIKEGEDAEGRWTPERFEAALRPLSDEGGRVVFDHRARLSDKTTISREGRHEFVVRQALVVSGANEAFSDGVSADEEDDAAWMIEGRIDLRADTAPKGPMIALTRIGE